MIFAVVLAVHQVIVVNDVAQEASVQQVWRTGFHGGMQPAGGSKGREMDIEVLRVLLFREFWQGLPSTGKKLPVKTSTEAVIEGPRLSPRKLAGQWKVFDVESTPFEDQDVVTGAGCFCIKPALKLAALQQLLLRTGTRPHTLSLQLCKVGSWFCG